MIKLGSVIKLLIILSSIFLIVSLIFWKAESQSVLPTVEPIETYPSHDPGNQPQPLSSESKDLPEAKKLINDYHVFQSFNNCGPAALSMALSYYGIHKSQQELGQSLRPYQNPQGDNDDKSVTLEEVAKEAEKYGLLPYHRPNGEIKKIKQFINIGVPVIARTYLKKSEDIGHYRIVKGYDDKKEEIIQDDSLQGKNLTYSYSDFMDLWADFNYEYLVLVPIEKQLVAEAILAEDLDLTQAWKKSVQYLEQKLSQNPNDATTLFNLSVAKHNTGDFAGSVKAFEQVEDQLTFRSLWYQIEPIQSYFEIGQDTRVLQITDQILNNHNRAFSELYILRAKVFLKQNQKQKAAEELAKAKLYNKNIFISEDLMKQI